ncbi:restriction endonuclease S subunit [[Clostridium] sordellii]|uniref:restriction endonuclease subunit S n=1 Tax=Paraclostridium sordellii TaxID=1505 RepID=UPI0005E5AA11|nr:restriction endonuclease subunit S [Paeniclostridium sordellii]CEQ05990.1 restriction endonuclease S subunit [[Clostridium] sordellii] [Paeniclostridium sordellii]
MSCKEWKEACIGDICEISSSKRIYAADYKENGIPFYRSKEIIELAINKSVTNELYISYEKFNQLDEKFGSPKYGDILLSSIGANMGIPYYVNTDEKFYFKDGNVTWFKNFKEDIYSKYLYFLLKSSYIQSVFSNIAIGSAQKALTIDSLKKINIKIPPLEEQEKIANILSSLDNKIELNNEMNKTLEDMAQSIFKRWFVDFEFPNEDGEPYKSSGGEMVDSELGMIPKGWEVKSIDELTNVTIGKTPPRKESQWFSLDSKDINWVSIKDLGKCGMYIFKTSEYLTKEAIEKFNVNMVTKDTVILSFKLTVGRVAITPSDMVTNEAIAHFKILDNEYLTKEYLYSYLKQFNYDLLGSTSSIATAVNSKIIKKIPIIASPLNVIREFTLGVNSIFEMIKNNELQIINLEEVRNSLLPKLISGEIRLD